MTRKIKPKFKYKVGYLLDIEEDQSPWTVTSIDDESPWCYQIVHPNLPTCWITEEYPVTINPVSLTKLFQALIDE